MYPTLNFDFAGTKQLDPRISFARATAATYFDQAGILKTAASGAARFDHDPLTTQSLGLFVEESRTNLAWWSATLDSTYWGKNRGTATANTTTAPDGAATADTFTENNLTGPHAFFSKQTGGDAILCSPDTAYTVSTFIKAGTRGFGCVGLQQNTAAGAFIGVYLLHINLNTGAFSATESVGTIPTSSSYAITDVGNGWYRISVTGTTAATAGIIQIIFGPSTGTTNSYTGDGVSTVHCWGVQVESGARISSYIPTVGGIGTRNADVATITGTNFSDFWQAGKGGVLVRARPGTVSGTRPWVQFDDGTSDNLIAIRGNGTDPELYIVDSTTPQAQIDAGTIAANTDYAMTAWWNTDDCKARLNSGAVFIDSSATIPTVDQMRIGSDGTNYLNGHIASIGYYDRFSSQIYTRRKNKAVFSLL